MTERTASSALDEYLVVECQLGSTEAFRILVHRWQRFFVRRARDLTGDPEAAHDVAQESWIGIVHGLHALRDPGSFRAWALRIVANKAHDWIRRERSRRRTARETPVDPVTSVPSDDREDDVSRVREGLAALDPGRRSLLRRHYLPRRPLGGRARVRARHPAGYGEVTTLQRTQRTQAPPGGGTG